MHITSNSDCRDWVDRAAQHAGALQPDDMDTWPGNAYDSDDVDDSSPSDHNDWHMDVDDFADLDPPPLPLPPPPIASRHPVSSQQTPQGKIFTVNEHPKGAIPHGEKVNTLYETIRELEKDPTNPAYPFALSEWNLAYYLGTSGLSNKAVDRYLKLPWVQSHTPPPYFKNSADLNTLIEALPSGPRWKSMWVTLDDAPKDPQLVFYRDIQECLTFLEANPAFEGNTVYAPCKEYLDKELTDRVYSDMNTADFWNECQAAVPDGITVNPAILASDGTHLTNFSGNKKIHPVLVSSGHINKYVRAKPSLRAFMLLAYVPDGKWDNVTFPTGVQAKLMPGILSRKLWHACMKLILEPLKAMGEKPIGMIDCSGHLRDEMAFLAAYIGDLPEQSMNAGLAPTSCVPCVATNDDLGSSKSCAPRTGKSILEAIRMIQAENPNASTFEFAQAAKDLGLNGVEEPWWEDFPGLDICKAICPDVLHGLHKAFKDHTAKWCKNVVGVLEMDKRYKALPNFPGFRHFSAGISKISQWSGKEHRDLQRSWLCAIHGAVPINVLKATRAELDFIYLAQYQSHSTSTLKVLVGYNATFHRYKNIFIAIGARKGKNGTINHFKIPKLHTRHHYPEFIRFFGSPDNFNTEAPERYHIDYAKIAYEHTSGKEYEEQMVRWLDRQEKLHFFDGYLKWRLNLPDEDQDSADNDDPVEELDSIPEPISTSLPTIAKRPIQKSQGLSELCKRPILTGLSSALQRYAAKKQLGRNATGPGWQYQINQLPDLYKYLDIWHLFRLKVPVLDDRQQPTETIIIHSAPATKTRDNKPKAAVHDVVFIDLDPEGQSVQTGVKGLRVGQIRLIFRPSNINKLKSHPHEKHLVYVEWFTKIPDTFDPNMQMYKVSKAYKPDHTRDGGDVVELEAVVQPCYIAPVFPKKADNLVQGQQVTGNNCLEKCNEFWINSFQNKPTYQTVY